VQQLLVALIIRIRFLLELTLFRLQFLFMQVTQLFPFSRSLHLHFVHLVVYFFVTLVVESLLLVNLPLKFLDSVLVLFELLLGLSLDVRFFLSNIIGKPFNFRLNFVAALFFNQYLFGEVNLGELNCILTYIFLVCD
jgi:hypothetical protein